MNAKSLVAPICLAVMIPAGHYALRPELATVAPPAAADAARLTPAKKSLNDAALQDLADLPGVGMKFAETFLEARPAAGFRSWVEVDAVKGVGAARLRLLQERFTLP